MEDLVQAQDNNNNNNNLPQTPNNNVPQFANINQGTVAVESSRAIAEAQGKLIIAKNFPRNYLQSYANALETCKRKSFAEKAFYSYPRGKETVTGVTIRFAESLAQAYGNIDYGIKELSHSDGKSEMQAFAWDLETNTISSQNFTVEHIRESKYGNTQLSSQRDIYELNANNGARRLRSRILAILPPDLVEDCIKECQRTLKADASMSLSDKIKTLLTYFKKFGVSQEMIEKRLGHSMETMTPDEVVEYSAIFTGLNNKETSVSDWFEQPKTASQMTELLKAAAEEEEKAKPKSKKEDK